jgi:hypothetical protein
MPAPHPQAPPIDQTLARPAPIQPRSATSAVIA